MGIVYDNLDPYDPIFLLKDDLRDEIGKYISTDGYYSKKYSINTGKVEKEEANKISKDHDNSYKNLLSTDFYFDDHEGKILFQQNNYRNTICSSRNRDDSSSSKNTIQRKGKNGFLKRKD